MKRELVSFASCTRMGECYSDLVLARNLTTRMTLIDFQEVIAHSSISGHSPSDIRERSLCLLWAINVSPIFQTRGVL